MTAATPAARDRMGDPAETAVLTAEAYIAAMQACDSDRRARQAFVDLALRSATPGDCILDFGAGPGIDARIYARHGLHVLAYDVDEQMSAAMTRHCADEIASGQVQLCQGDYRDFLERQVPSLRQRYAVQLVTANFAPLNLIDDPRALFAALHALTLPGALFLASVLNGDYLGDMRYRWWWANRRAYWLQGQFCVPGARGKIYRRSHRYFASAAMPYFKLQSVARGLPPVRPRARPTGWQLTTSRYLFLLFARR